MRERKDFRIVAFSALEKPEAEDYKVENKRNATVSNQDGVLGFGPVLLYFFFPGGLSGYFECHYERIFSDGCASKWAMAISNVCFVAKEYFPTGNLNVTV